MTHPSPSPVPPDPTVCDYEFRGSDCWDTGRSWVTWSQASNPTVDGPVLQYREVDAGGIIGLGLISAILTVFFPAAVHMRDATNHVPRCMPFPVLVLIVLIGAQTVVLCMNAAFFKKKSSPSSQ